MAVSAFAAGALRRACVLSPGRRDARDDHGRERLLRDHPGALGARPREAAGARAGPAARTAREAAFRAQQLPDAAGRVHDARRHFPLAFGSDHAWLVLLAIFAIVAAIRHFFNLWHTGRRLVDPRRGRRPSHSRSRSRRRTPRPCRPTDDAALAIVADRCQTCHLRRNRAAGRPTRERGAARAARGRDRGAGLLERDAAGERDRMTDARAARRLGRGARLGSAGARDHRRRNALRRPLGGRLAPQTVAAFKAILPLEDRIIHCRWSGESNWIPWGDRDLGIGPENATSYPHGRARALPRRRERDGAALPLRLLPLQEQGRRAVGEPLRDARRGAEQLEELGRLTSGKARSRSRSASCRRGGVGS